MSQLAIYNPNPLTPYAPREQGDYYPTDPRVIQAGIGFLPARIYHDIIEPGAGNNAPFLQVLGDRFTDAWRYAVEERDPIQPEHLKLDPKSVWFPRKHFIRDFNHSGYYSDYFDLVATNPPFGDRWEQDQKRENKAHKAATGLTRKMPPRPDNEPRADAEAFLRKSIEILKPGGIYMSLMRTAFWSGIERATGLFTEIRPYLIATITPRPSFRENLKGTDGTEYAFFFFEKGYNPKRPEADFCIWK